MRLFKCDFGDGLTCEVSISETLPPEGSTHIQSHFWSKTPSKKVLRPYVAWMNSVNQQLANEWNKCLMHTYQVDKKIWECWIFIPGEKPKFSERFYA